MEQNSPLRILVKSYENGLLDRDRYLDIRKKLLIQLSKTGHITHNDLKKYLNFNDENISSYSSYTALDWLVIILGLLAALTLGIFLFS